MASSHSNTTPQTQERVLQQHSTADQRHHSKTSSQPLTISKTTDINQTVERLPIPSTRRGLRVPKPRLSPRNRRPRRKRSTSAMVATSVSLQKPLRTVHEDNDGCPSPIIHDRRPKSVHLPFFRESPGWRDAHEGRAVDDCKVNSRTVRDPLSGNPGYVPGQSPYSQIAPKHIETASPDRRSSVDTASSPKLWCVNRANGSPKFFKAGKKLRHFLIHRREDAASDRGPKAALTPAARSVPRKSSSKRLIGRIRGKPAMEDLRAENQAGLVAAAADANVAVRDTVLLPSAEDSPPAEEKALGNQTRHELRQTKSSSVSSFQMENSYLGQQIHDGQRRSSLTGRVGPSLARDAEGAQESPATRYLSLDHRRRGSVKESKTVVKKDCFTTMPPVSGIVHGELMASMQTGPRPQGAAAFSTTAPLSPLQPASPQAPNPPASPPRPGPRTSSRGLAKATNAARRVELRFPTQQEQATWSPSQASRPIQQTRDGKNTPVITALTVGESSHQATQHLRGQKSSEGLSFSASAPTNSTSTLEGIESQVRYSNSLSTSSLDHTAQDSDTTRWGLQRSHNVTSPVAHSAKAPSDPPMDALPELPEFAGIIDEEAGLGDCHPLLIRPSSRPRLHQPARHHLHNPSMVSTLSEASSITTVRAGSLSPKYRHYQDGSSPRRANSLRSTVSHRRMPAVDTTPEVNQYNLGSSRDLRSSASIHSQESVLSASGTKITRYSDINERTQRVHHLRHRDVASERQRKKKLRKVDEQEVMNPAPIPEDFPHPPSFPSTRPSSRQSSRRSSYQQAQPSSPLRRTTTSNDLRGQISRSNIIVLADSNPHTEKFSASTVTPTASMHSLRRTVSPAPLLPSSNPSSIMARKIPRKKQSQRSVRSYMSRASQFSVGNRPQAQTPPPSDSSTPSSDEEGVILAIHGPASREAAMMTSRKSIIPLPLDIHSHFERRLHDMQLRLDRLEEENEELRNQTRREVTDMMFKFLKHSRKHDGGNVTPLGNRLSGTSAYSWSGTRQQQHQPRPTQSLPEEIITELNEPARVAQVQGRSGRCDVEQQTTVGDGRILLLAGRGP